MTLLELQAKANETRETVKALSEEIQKRADMASALTQVNRDELKKLRTLRQELQQLDTSILQEEERVKAEAEKEAKTE